MGKAARLLSESDYLLIRYYLQLFYLIKLAASDSHSELDRPDALFYLIQEQGLEYDQAPSLAPRSSKVGE